MNSDQHRKLLELRDATGETVAVFSTLDVDANDRGFSEAHPVIHDVHVGVLGVLPTEVVDVIDG